MTTPIYGIGLVENVCKKTPNYELCVKVLSADPRAPQADITTLATIMIDADKVKCEETNDFIKKLIKTRPDLERCHFLYQAGILKVLIPDAYQTMRDNTKIAEASMVDVAEVAQQCENHFQKGKSPITALNTQVQDLSGVAAAILHLL